MKSDRRGSWYLLTGIILGAALGLVYSWEISPVKYIDAPPSALRSDYKDDYRALVASAYLYSNDLLRAESRLAQLKDENPVQSLTIQAQQAQLEGLSKEEVQALETLASALAAAATPTDLSFTSSFQSTSTPPSSQLTPTSLITDPTAITQMTSTVLPTVGYQYLPIFTNTPEPSRSTTPSPAPGVPYVLQETQMVCNINQTIPLIQVDIRDAQGQPVPSVEVIVTWDTGEDHFFTGLQPEMGLGYGDFPMHPDVVYSIHLAGGGEPVNNLAAAECTAQDGSHYWGSWHLVFVQP